VSDQLTDWAFVLLRPVLKQLRVQELTREPRIVRASEHSGLISAGLERWVIIAQQITFQDGERGCITVAFDKARNLFLMSICIDEHLYIDDSLELRTQRKMIAVHEFVHGSAHMFTSSFLSPRNYIDIINQSMNSKVKMTTSEEFDAILLVIRQPNAKGVISLPDGHYRLVVDGFGGNYSELFTNLLLSYQLVCEVMMSVKQQYPNLSFSEYLRRTINELIENKALDSQFVFGRIRSFVPRLFSDFLET